MQDLADICLPRADAATRAQLATVLMPQASSMHDKLELLARRDAIAARVKEVLAIAADGRDDVLDLVIDLDLAEAAA